MKISTTGFTLLHLAFLCNGAPAPGPIAETEITFQGAGPNPPQYTLEVPCNGVTFTINNALSVSHIISNDLTANCACTFNGVDGSVTSTFEDEEVDVGPPQTQVSGVCEVVSPSLKSRQPALVAIKARQEGFEATLTFQGAGPNPPEYTLTVPCDESTFTIDNPLSVSHIISDDTRTCLCTLNGVDGSVTTTFGNETVDVGPPQAQVSGNCGAVFPNKKTRQLAVNEVKARQVIEGVIRFIGAGPNPPEYDLNVPCDGSTFFTNNALSISHIHSDVPNDCFCTFSGIDGSVTSTVGVDDVDVGPPQTQVSGFCQTED